MRLEERLVEAVGTRRGVDAANRLCEMCVVVLSVDAAVISLILDGSHTNTLGASSPAARAYDELEFTLGEGPCRDSVTARAPIQVDDLAAVSGRWPVYAPAMVSHDIHGMYAMPVVVAGEYLGALNLYRSIPGPLSTDQFAGALIAAELTQMPVLDLVAEDLDAAVNDPGHRGWADINALSRTDVNQAVGMLVAQLDIEPVEALVRLRAFAYSDNRPLSDVARDILAHELRLELDS